MPRRSADWLRQRHDHPTADAIRSALSAAGVELQDTDNSTHWQLRDGVG